MYYFSFHFVLPPNTQVLLKLYVRSFQIKVGKENKKLFFKENEDTSLLASTRLQSCGCCPTRRFVRGNDLSLLQGLRRGPRAPLPSGTDWERSVFLCQLPKITQWEQPSSLSLKACKSKP